MSGRVTTIDVVVDDPSTMYVGTASGGVWKSESGGINWKPIFDEQPTLSIGDLAIYQQNTDVIWVGTGEGNPRNSQSSGGGVYRSLDGGKSWELMGLESTRNIHRIVIHPENPEVVYVGAQGTAWGDTPDRGVYKTTDGGKTWEKILFVNNRTGVGDMVIDPKNPNKLLVAMWEFRRWPYFFKSGGDGSGLYVTFDGGTTWKERTHEDGLPEGELGRIGLAIAPSKPEVVYALVESKKNALYRSEDGGFKWKKVNDKEEIGNRPFYYADIFVDPSNENRLYSLHSLVSMSEDGGRSFEVIMPYYGATSVHPDHHAWWVHPKDPNFLINGNDGGMAISRDMGKNWRFVENLPLAQFYHISVDNDMPYNVYGGMQDNGSWRGPAYVWRSGGIRNAYWEELFFGDGFDVVPDPENSRYGYAMSQGGSLGRYDWQTGYSKMIVPQHPEGITLRFNWNAAIAQDPFDPATIYYGSQFVHKSIDKGENWEIISPDLTTNDPNKQNQLESGGLTYDVTQAENNTTIVSIAPSPLKKGVIWVGTDDGNVQLTTNGGESWQNLIGNIKNAPDSAWVTQIQASRYNEGEAFVVINNYRQNDWKPYLFHTADYGKTWQQLADAGDVNGHCLSFAQDPEAPNLMFLGTEGGLYFSIDGGKVWNKWHKGYPSAPTIDLVIHPREHDLVIGTFGRAAWIIDDIRPLRAMAKEGTGLLNKTLYAFETPTAVLAEYAQASGTRFAANAIYLGDNRPYGAMLTYSVKVGKKELEEDSQGDGKNTEGEAEQAETPLKKVKIEVMQGDDVLYTFYHEPKSGLNRTYWNLRKKGARSPGSDKPKPNESDPSGLAVLPGTYKVRYHWQGSTDSTTVKVIMDPRIEVSEADLIARNEMMEDFYALYEAATKATDQLKAAKETMDLVAKQLPEGDSSESVKAMKDLHNDLKKQIKSLEEMLTGKENVQGIYRDPEVISSLLGRYSYYLGSSLERPNGNQKTMLELAKMKMEPVMEKVNAFFQNDWKAYQEQVEEMETTPFKHKMELIEVGER